MAGQSEMEPVVPAGKPRLHHQGQLPILDSLSGCVQPIASNGHGSDTSLFRNNLIERGGATNTTQAIVGSGKFKLIGNHLAGFEGNNKTTRP